MSDPLDSNDEPFENPDGEIEGSVKKDSSEEEIQISYTPHSIIEIYRIGYPYFKVNQVLPGTEIVIKIVGDYEKSIRKFEVIDAAGEMVKQYKTNDAELKLLIKEESFPGPVLVKITTHEIEPPMLETVEIELTKEEIDGNLPSEEDQDMEDIDLVIHDVVIEHTFYIVDTITELVPEIKIYREDNMYGEASQFLGNDLIHLVVKNVGLSKTVIVKMLDSRHQVRYHGRKGGLESMFTTRLQKTKTLGDWKYNITGSLPETEEDFELDYPFYLVDEITEIVKDVPPMVQVEEIDPEESTEVIEDLNNDQGSEPKIIERIEYIEVEKRQGIPEIIGEIDPFGSTSLIKGIGPASEKLLFAADVTDVISVALDEPIPLAEKIGKSEKSTSTWINNAQIALFGNVIDVYDDEISVILQNAKEWKDKQIQLFTASATKGVETIDIEFPEVEENEFASQPTSAVKGIGPATEKKLTNVGIHSVLTLAKADTKSVADKLNLKPSKITQWIENAQMLVYGKVLVKMSFIDDENLPLRPKETQVINQPNTKIEELTIIANYDVKGTPSLVKGIGPATEKKLIAQGIVQAIQLTTINVSDIAAKLGLTENKVKKWKELALIDIHGVIPS